jgi:hypothetical protein
VLHGSPWLYGGPAKEEIAMNARPEFGGSAVPSRVVAALLACALSGGLLGTVSGMFQRDGVPFERIVAAARDCAGYAFVSEREACIGMVAEARLQRDFGVLDARWRAQDRRVKEKLAGSDEWFEFNCPPLVHTAAKATSQTN